MLARGNVGVVSRLVVMSVQSVCEMSVGGNVGRMSVRSVGGWDVGVVGAISRWVGCGRGRSVGEMSARLVSQ